LVAAALAVYWSALRNPPVFDDGQLTRQFLRAYGSTGFKLDGRWFSYASFGWSFNLFGRDWFWLRLGNVLLHAATAAALFALLSRLFDAVLQPRPVHRWYAFMGALVFLVHPVAIYAVAYLMQRSTVMATLFGLVSLLLFLEGLRRRSHGWYAASVLAYFVAVFSKEHCVMLPAVAAAMALLLRGASWKLVRELWLPFALYLGVAVLVTLKLKGLLGAAYEPFGEAAVRQLAESERAVHGHQDQLPGGRALYPLSVLNQATLFFRYLGTWLLPYPGWMSADVRTAFPQQLGSGLHLAGFVAWLAYAFAALAMLVRGGRVGLAGLALAAPWLLALTEVSTVRIQEPFVLYRSYLWMCPLPAAIPALVGGLRPRTAFVLLGAIALALLAPFAERLKTFSSEYALWDDVVRKNAGAEGRPFVDRGYRNRGVALFHQERYDAALRDFERALALDPGSALAWLTRGTLFMRIAESGKALPDLDRAAQLDPGSVEAFARRCVVLMRLARYDEALADCRRALELDALDPLHHTSLGMVHALRGERAQAESHYRQALALDPGFSDAHYQYGVLLNGTGRRDEARAQFIAACRGGLQRACDAAVKLRSER
jgi:tetratricopeptide (TPR) repeat protein